jgi:hypothetical protein
MAKSAGNTAKVKVDYSEPKPEAPKPKAKPRPRAKRRWKPLPLRLNKNFMNYPLARDVRTAMEWEEKSDQLVATLPREDLIQLSLPANAPDYLRHAPSGFDMRLVFLWIALIQHYHKVRWIKGRKQTYIEASQSELLRLLDLVVRDQNRKALQASEGYWSMVTIQYNAHGKRGWYAEYGVERQVKKLPPPIVAREGKILIIHPDWAKLALDVWIKYLPTPAEFIGRKERPWRQAKLPTGYFTPMPALVPVNAAAQNAVLMTMASIDLTTHKSGRSDFARKIGLSRKNRNRRRESALEEAAAWYQDHDGELTWKNKGAMIEFTKKEPKVPKSPKKGEGL